MQLSSDSEADDALSEDTVVSADLEQTSSEEMVLSPTHSSGNAEDSRCTTSPDKQCSDDEGMELSPLHSDGGENGALCATGRLAGTNKRRRGWRLCTPGIRIPRKLKHVETLMPFGCRHAGSTTADGKPLLHITQGFGVCPC